MSSIIILPDINMDDIIAITTNSSKIPTNWEFSSWILSNISLTLEISQEDPFEVNSLYILSIASSLFLSSLM